LHHNSYKHYPWWSKGTLTYWNTNEDGAIYTNMCTLMVVTYRILYVCSLVNQMHMR